MTKPEIIEELNKLKIEFDENAHVFTLQALLKKAQGGSSEKTNSSIEKGNLIVWLKSRAYINDVQRLNAGVYSMDKLPIRLSQLPVTIVEVFEDEVPARKLAAIAKWTGITHPEDFDDEELLNKVLSEAEPF